MIIINTSTQPFIVLCLLLSGMVYSVIFFFINKIELNKILNNMINFILVLLGAMIYFTVLFLVNHGEMRLFTLISYVSGLLIGYKLITIISVKRLK